jgi:UDP-N-acetylmuramate dehydrogenase
MPIQNDFPLSQILFYKIGGKAKYLINCESGQEIREALKFITKNKIDNVFICGLGSNLIFSDEKFDGVVVRIVQEKKSQHNFQKKDNLVTVFSGMILDDLIKFAFDNHLIGLEWAGGLPGTVGAGIRGNVGAFGHEIKDTIHSVDVLEKSGARYQARALHKDELNFSYRNSLIKENRNMIVTSATFNLSQASPQELAKAKDTYEANIHYRRTHHPVEYPTCGSVFKNINEADRIKKVLTIWPDIRERVTGNWHNKVAMGYVINRLGFSGKRKGGMQVSEKHNNFIINVDNGHASDALFLINEIQNKVQKTFGFTPETEAEIVNEQ